MVGTYVDANILIAVFEEMTRLPNVPLKCSMILIALG